VKQPLKVKTPPPSPAANSAVEKSEGADTSVVEAAFLASQDLQESSSLDQTESPDDQKDSGASSKEDEPFEDQDDTKVNTSAKDDANTPPPANSSNEPLNEE